MNILKKIVYILLKFRGCFDCEKMVENGILDFSGQGKINMDADLSF